VTWHHKGQMPPGIIDGKSPGYNSVCKVAQTVSLRSRSRSTHLTAGLLDVRKGKLAQRVSNDGRLLHPARPLLSNQC
jgi:hypothetical protein